MTDYTNFHQHMNTYDTMFFNKCVNMTYDRDELNIMCNPNAFYFIDMLFTFLYSTSIGVFLSFALVAFFMNTDDDSCVNTTEEEEQKEDEAKAEISNDVKNFIAECNEEFHTLPKDGYVIDAYPFSRKLETNTPFGDIIMHLNVYKEDYADNDESIEYVYYTQTNTWTFEQLLCVAKKLAVKLNTRQFYKDKTIRWGTTKDELIAQRERERELAMAAVSEEKAANETAVDEKPVSETPPEEPSVFAKFKSYNRGHKSTHHVPQKKHSEEKDAIVITPVRMRRAGTLDEYKVERLKEEVKKRMKNISFSDFKVKSKND